MFLITNAEQYRNMVCNQKKWLIKKDICSDITFYSMQGNLYSNDSFLLTDSSNDELIKKELANLSESLEKPELNDDKIVSSDIHNINGKFLILKKIRESIYLITDRFGLIQLFQAEKEDKFVICSEIDYNLIKNLGFVIKDLKLFNPKDHFIKISFSDNNFKINLLNRKNLIFEKVISTENKIIKKLALLADNAILSSLINIKKQEKKIAVLFSGGVDSTTLCFLLQKNNIPFQAYVVGRKDSEDILYAINVAKQLSFDLTTVIIDHILTQESLTLIEEIIQTRFFTQTVSTVPPPVTLAIAIPYFFGMKKISQDGLKTVLTAIGTEEFFAGFEHWDKKKTIQELSEIKAFTIYQRDFYRDTRLASHFSLKIIMPFINLDLALFGLGIPVNLKLKNGIKKSIWREASKFIGIPAEFCNRKNKATQYGSKSNLILEKIAKNNGFRKGYIKQQLVDSIYSNLKETEESK